MTAPAAVERRAQVIRLRGQGLSLRQVAARLGVSHMTVKRDLQDPDTAAATSPPDCPESDATAESSAGALRAAGGSRGRLHR